MTKRVGQIIATKEDKAKPVSPSKSRPEEGMKGQRRNPVLWPETTEPAPTFKKPTKKSGKK